MKFISVFTDTNYTFEGQRPNERVIVLLYRHWFTLALPLFGYLVMAFVPVIVYVILLNFDMFSYFQGLYTALTAAFYLLWWYSLFYRITMYLLDTWIITDHRVIDSEQHGFFSRTVGELNLSKIEDVSTSIQGPIATWLKFGNLEIQTAGASQKFSLKQIPDPVGVEELLMRTHNEYHTHHLDGTQVEVEQGQ